MRRAPAGPPRDRRRRGRRSPPAGAAPAWARRGRSPRSGARGRGRAPLCRALLGGLGLRLVGGERVRLGRLGRRLQRAVIHRPVDGLVAEELLGGGRAADVVALLVLERLVAVEAAVARAGQRRVRAPPAVAEDRGAAAARLLGLVALVLLLGGELGLGLDVDPPAGQAGGEAGVLALAADRQRELVVGHDDGRLAALVVDEHLAHARRRQRLGDEAGGLVVVGDDVDLLAAQLAHDHAHARAARPDARADRVDAVLMRDDGDLRAVARLARDVLDLDEAVGDLRDLELEQRLDQLAVAARDDDRRALRGGRDLLDDRLDALVVLVALALDLLGLGQQRLDALAQLDERVAGVLLLDDAGDQLADAVAVLLVHHVPLGLADPLEDHLLGGLRGDAAEVVRGDVPLVDLVLVLLELDRIDLRLLGLAHLPRLGVHGRLLVNRLDDQMRLEALGDDQLGDDEVRGLGVDVDPRVLRRAGLLLVGRQERVLEGDAELVRGDALLARARAHGLQDLSGHGYSSTRLDRVMSPKGMATRPAGAAMVTSASQAPTSSPVNDLCPSCASRVRTRARRPRKRRKCAGFVSGRWGPGLETSS